MKKFLLGLAAGFFLAGLACLIVVFAFIRLGERRPVVREGSTLVLRLEGPVPELEPMEIPIPLLESRRPLTVLGVWDLMRKAAADSRVNAVVFQPRAVGAGWGKLDEIRSNLVQFKASGKPLIAFLRGPGVREYYLATAADRIYMSREDMLDLKGLRAELTFYRRTMDKLGVSMEAEYAGKYKDAADAFLRTGMTPETREVINSVLDHVYGRLVDSVAAARGKSPAEVRAIIDEGPFLAAQAQAKGLVDELMFEDQMFSELRQRLGQEEIRKLSHRDYARVPASAVGLEGRARVALVVGEGVITRGGELFAEEEGIRSEAFARLLREVGEDTSIRGVILRINSPGGDSFASDEILHHVRELSKKKPLVISMSDLAASGGYYISMSGDPVVAYPSTFTGSIGVVFGKVDLSGLYDKLGFNKELVTRGRNADIDSEARPLSEAGRKKLREGLTSVYRSFLERVAEGRRKKVEEVEPLAQGRLWLGAQARENGLIDELGGLDQAIEKIREKARIGAEEKIRLVRYPRRKTIFEHLFGEPQELSLDGVLAWKWRRAMARLGVDNDHLKLWERGGFLRVAPYTLSIQ